MPLADSRWPEADSRLPYFHCQLCRRPWSERERANAVRNGQWRATYRNRAIRGYHLSQLLSPVVSAERLVRAWYDAERSPHGRQVFYNSILGLPYVAEGARFDRRLIEDALARGGEPMAGSSQGSVLGVDVGPEWLHVVIAEPVNDLLKIIWAGKIHEWEDLAELLMRYRVRAYVIDAMPETHQARRFVRRFPQGALCWYTEAKSTERVVQDANLRVSRTETLDAMYRRWQQAEFITPRDLPAEFAEHLESLVRVVRPGRDGRLRADYLAAGRADHYAHALNYCTLAAEFARPRARFEIQMGGLLG